MGRNHECIDQKLETFLLAQPVFFVATAPLAEDGHVNCSPKGLKGTFAVSSPSQFAYLDLTGSGAETIAHLRENRRITLMFCAFVGPPRIVRLYGKGRAVLSDDPSFGDWLVHFESRLGARAVIVAVLDRITDSCGFGVPRMELVDERDQLDSWSAKKGEAGLAEYRKNKNVLSIDGLPALPTVESGH